jgi:hypothetical protein
LSGKSSQGIGFYVSALLIALTVLLSLAVFHGWVDVRFRVGPFFFTHLLAWMGAIYYAVYTPLYFWLKRRSPQRIKLLVNLHVYGNLLAFMMISTHISSQLSRPEFFTEVGTGLALYIVIVLLVATGFLHRYQLLPKSGVISKDMPHVNRYVHAALTLSLYIILVVHVLRNVGII